MYNAVLLLWWKHKIKQSIKKNQCCLLFLFFSPFGPFLPMWMFFTMIWKQSCVDQEKICVCVDG